MRSIRLLLPVAVAGIAFLASSCGVSADTTAATVAGESIPIEDVNTLVESPAFNTGISSPNESTQDGALARSALQFLIMRQVWLTEADRWGIEIDDSLRGEVGRQLDQQAAQSDQEPLKGRLRDFAIDFGLAQQLVVERIASIDTGNDEDLRRLYDSTDLTWRRVCLTVVQIPAGSVDNARRSIEDGATVDELAKDISGAEVATDPSQGCFTEAELVPELRDDLAGAPTGVTRGVVIVGDEQTGRAGYAYRIERRTHVGFDDARKELTQLVAGFAGQGATAWGTRLALAAEVNPRYGSGVTRGSRGFVVLPPERPQVPVEQMITDAVQSADTDSGSGG